MTEKPQKSSSITRLIALVIPVAAVLFLCAWTMKNELAGTRPTQSYEEMMAAEGGGELYSDKEVDALRARVSADKQDVASRKELIEMLGSKFSEVEESSPIIMEVIRLHTEILDVEPNDAGTLRNLADISFNFRVVDKARNLYERYLVLQPEDHAVRVRYGAVLTLAGEVDRAVSELETVLAVRPTDFGALVNLSIAHAERGDVAKSEQIGKQALAHAPDQAARERFRQFLESRESTADVEQAEGEPDSSELITADLSGVAAQIVLKVQGNAVAGPKFVGAHQNGERLELVFDNFPMEQMPPFARDKFLTPLQAELDKGIAGQDVGQVVFIEKRGRRILHIMMRS